jgi:hypothetical protein
MAQPLDSRTLEPHRKQWLDRRLRNQIIAGNAIIWIVILILIRLI